MDHAVRVGRRHARLAKSVLVLALTTAGLVSSPAVLAQTFSPETQKHLESAIKNSGGDLALINHYREYSCDAVEDTGMYDRSSPERHAVRVPLTQIFVDVDFPDGIPRLVFAHVVYGIPITTLIFRSYYATIPEDLIEAARMDRAGMLRTYWSVVLPVSAPAFVVTAIWQFTSIWNDFLFAVFIVTDPSQWPVTVALNNTTGSIVTPYNVQMAAALIASIPTLIVYILLGRYFMRGLMAGALKG